MPKQEDLVFIKEIIRGDVSAFEKLVDRYKRQVYTLALRIVKNEYDAEEVSQDAFLKAYRALGKFKQEAKFSTWLYRIAYNTALSKIKKKRLETASLNDEHYEIANGNVTEVMSHLINEDRSKYLKYAISQLSEEEGSLINLHYSLDKDMAEVAEIMGLSHVNVRVKLSRARKKLYTILEKVLKKELKNIV